MPILKATQPKEGDTLALISPASWVTEDKIAEAKEKFTAMGFNVIHSHRIFERHGYLAGTDQSRVSDLHEMFLNPEVKIIVCLRGGYGTQRILPLIDYSLIAANPKVFMGFSDITALLNTIHQKTGLITFHGPVGTTAHTSYTLEMLKNVLAENDAVISPIASMKKEAYSLLDGVAEGQLAGGNLSLIVSSIGTPFEQDFADKIVCIEEVGEAPYQIDRMLTQLLLSNKLQKTKAIVLGTFSDCNLEDEPEKREKSLSLKEVITDRLGSLGIPVVYGMPFGHVSPICTLPIGIRARIDTRAQTLQFLERATAPYLR